MRVTNNSGIPLALAVWLLSDDYDFIDEPNYISVTTLMRPLRQIIIPRRIPQDQKRSPDVSEFIARKLGHAVHDSIERAWINHYQRSLSLMGYPDDVIERVLINPSIEMLKVFPDAIPVYLEQRQVRKIVVDGVEWSVGGKFDMVTEGIVNDTKSTSAWGWKFGTRDDEHIQQGSLYRWVDDAQEHKKITQDFMRVNYVFTDWQKAMTRDPSYPQKRLESKEFPLWSVQNTEEWVRNKIKQIAEHINTHELHLPECTDEEIWRSEPKFKYFADPEKAKDKTAKSTKNFDSLSEANAFKAEKGKGVVVTVPGEPKRCREYCEAFDFCTQKDRYFSS